MGDELYDRLSEVDWHEVQAALADYTEYLIRTEPAALNTIKAFHEAAMSCPMPEDFR
jgi:hypothetical protein